jgi:hypothetical protein
LPGIGRGVVGHSDGNPDPWTMLHSGSMSVIA